MKSYNLSAIGIEVIFDLGLGQISKLVVTRDGRELSPFHTVLWRDDPNQEFPEGTDPHLERMSVDFFCAPFAKSDIENTPLHGWPANAPWTLLEEEDFEGGKRASFLLSKTVMGGQVIKTLTVRDRHPFLYQSHSFVGSQGSIPVAYHPMVSLPSGGVVSVSPKLRAETMAISLEPDPERGKSALAYPSTSEDLHAFQTSDGGQVDLLRYPIADINEDLVMLIENPANPLGWTAVVRPNERDIAIVLKQPAVLPATIFWYSNGGRFYAPWNGRHRGVLGVEEACTYFAYGHSSSISDNHLSRNGIKTAISLEGDPEIRCVIGASTLFGHETEAEKIDIVDGQLRVTMRGGHNFMLPYDADFLAKSAKQGAGSGSARAIAD